MSPIDHILLYSIMFASFYFFCKLNGASTDSKKFWKLALVPILFYALIEGSRFGRGVDYLPYKYRFEHLNYSDEPQKGFYAWMFGLNAIGFNYVMYYITNALLFVSCTFYFIRKCYAPIEGKWMYLLAIFAMMGSQESMIRQYIAFPILLIGITFMFEKKNWWKGIVSVLIANSIHSGTMVIVPFLVLSYFFIKKTLNYKITIPILLLAYYVIPSGALTNTFTSLLGALNLSSLLGSDNLSHYVTDSDRWLGEGSVLEAAEQSNLTKTLQFLFESCVLYVSYIALKKRPNQKVIYLYNLVIVGFIMCRLFHGFEIFTRMFMQLYIWWFVPAGYAIAVYSHSLKLKHLSLMKYCFCAMWAYQIFYWGRYVFLSPKSVFFWDI